MDHWVAVVAAIVSWLAIRRYRSVQETVNGKDLKKLGHPCRTDHLNDGRLHNLLPAGLWKLFGSHCIAGRYVGPGSPEVANQVDVIRNDRRKSLHRSFPIFLQDLFLNIQGPVDNF
ncbi:Hypothetical protein NTJ_00764 [Nesidiocoris tenuis]|uniref:Secreted protein n=1 Tax=Nesidiocoris tenuis TaxID=355587 RepID=A0ABN7A6T2_9HEMI|nr:Hypothetical protein NTJ_00764 [Nesidiocoris tenuis]